MRPSKGLVSARAVLFDKERVAVRGVSPLPESFFSFHFIALPAGFKVLEFAQAPTGTTF